MLELSLREALGLHHGYIGTEHILLGLIREGEGLAARVLTGRGAPGDRNGAGISARRPAPALVRGHRGEPSPLRDP